MYSLIFFLILFYKISILRIFKYYLYKIFIVILILKKNFKVFMFEINSD